LPKRSGTLSNCQFNLKRSQRVIQIQRTQHRPLGLCLPIEGPLIRNRAEGHCPPKGAVVSSNLVGGPAVDESENYILPGAL
jgi:hypothetical protein